MPRKDPQDVFFTFCLAKIHRTSSLPFRPLSERKHNEAKISKSRMKIKYRICLYFQHQIIFISALLINVTKYQNDIKYFLCCLFLFFDLTMNRKLLSIICFECFQQANAFNRTCIICWYDIQDY